MAAGQKTGLIATFPDYLPLSAGEALGHDPSVIEPPVSRGVRSENDRAFPMKADDWEYRGGFEESVLLNRNVARSGSGSLLLMTYSRDARPPRLQQSVMLEPAAKYTFEGWFRSAFFRDATTPVLSIELSYNSRAERGGEEQACRPPACCPCEARQGLASVQHRFRDACSV